MSFVAGSPSTPHRRIAPLLAALAFAAALAPAAAWADPSDADRATARALAAEGHEALDKNDFAVAIDRFGRADALVHAPTLLLGRARAEVGLGRLVTAQETYNRILREGVTPGAPPAFAAAVESAAQDLGALAPRIPTVTILVKGPTPDAVTLDDEPVPAAALGAKRPVNPGKHVIRARAVGAAPAQATVTLPEGGAEVVTLELKPGPTPPPSPPVKIAPAAPPPIPPPASSRSTQKTLGFVALGVGGAGLVLGGIAGGLTVAKHGSLQMECNKNSFCAPKYQPDIDSYHLTGTLSTAGFLLGGAGVVAGTILVLTAPKPRRGAWIAPVIGPTYLGAEGAF